MYLSFYRQKAESNPVDDIPDDSTNSAYPDSDCIDTNLIGGGGIDAAGFPGCSM
jgi:hypothetical protein